MNTITTVFTLLKSAVRLNLLIILLSLSILTSCQPGAFPGFIASPSNPVLTAPNALGAAHPTTPPDASKITVSIPNIDGYATITGKSGAVGNDTAVAIINLSSRSVITATASSSGAFNANLFAPPGSSLLVKYTSKKELIDELWGHALNPGGDNIYMNPLPGATIFVPGKLPDSGGTPFHSAGFFGPGEGPNWAGWWMSGQVSGPGKDGDLRLQPGAEVTVNGTMHMTSPALNCSNPPPFTPNAIFRLRPLFGPDGQAYHRPISFNSYLFTPTGLPIEHEPNSSIQDLGGATILNLSCLSKNTIRGDFATSFTIPTGLAEGVYGLDAFVNEGGIPLASGVPRVVVWYHFDPLASLPPLTVGSPAPPRIPWTLFGDYPVNGHRGVQAVQDIGRYQMVTRTILAPHRAVIPMLDARSKLPVAYRLEPGSNWLSATDRRFPNPPGLPLALPGGELQAIIEKPDGRVETVGPAPFLQSSVRTPSLPDGSVLDEGTGYIGDLFHPHTRDEAFAYSFDQYGPHIIFLSGYVEDVYGNQYPIAATYEVMVARVLDLDPAQLPTTPYKQGNAFAPGLHLFPPVPANVEVRLVHMPLSDPTKAQETVIHGQANRFGYFQPPAGTEIIFDSPGEFRVDISAEYLDADGTKWAGYVTWGSVVEGTSPLIEAHGRRGMDYASNKIDDMPTWFTNAELRPEKIGIENYYPYFSGDIHWGDELAPPPYRGDSIQTVVTLRDLTGSSETIYDLMRQHFPRSISSFRFPPIDFSLTGLEKRLDVGEAPLFISTSTGRDPAIFPDEIDLWGYWYGSSERPDVHVREIISVDNIGTAYWRFNDTYGYQIGEPADGDQPGDLKWEFGGVVFRVPDQDVNEYAIYSSLWVLLPHDCAADTFGCARVTPPFQDATGAGINGGPIMTLLNQDIDMLFLPKGVRPGDVLEIGDTVAFSGHVGPPLDSRVEVTITSPSGSKRSRTWHANKIGWLYDPAFDFVAGEAGRWTVDVLVEHDRPYIGNGIVPKSHNTGTVMGTSGQYEFYVVGSDSSRLLLIDPQPGFITWPNQEIEPIVIRGWAPAGATAVHYTIRDKGVVMDQGKVTPDSNGLFSVTYNAKALHNDFPMLSLTAHEGRREGLADEVTIQFLALGAEPQANSVTLIGEEIFVGNAIYKVALPMLTVP